MVKVKLTIGERFVLNKILNERGNNLTFISLKSALKVSDKSKVSEEELKTAGYGPNKKDSRNTWKDEGSEKEMELSQDEKKLLIECFDKRDKEAKYSIVEGKFAINLVEKIKESKDE